MNALSYSKKGQIGMLETLMILVIIGIIIGIGIYLVYIGVIKEAEETADELSAQERNVLLAVIGKLPEINCAKDNCIDTTKLVAANSIIKANKDYYVEMLGFRTVNIEVLYPEKNAINCNDNNYPDCGVFKLYENKKKNFKFNPKMSVIVSLHYPAESKYKAGRLILEEYR